MNSKGKILIADVALIFATAIWSTTFVSVKWIIDDINPLALIGYRFILAAAIMCGYLILTKKNILSNIKEGFTLGIFMLIIYLPQTIGLKYTQASNSGFITGLFIVFIPIFGYLLFKEIPNKIKIFTVILAVGGLSVLKGGIANLNFGDILTLITAIACALHILYTGKFVKNEVDPFVLTFQQFFITGAISFIFSFMTGADITIKNSFVFSTIIILSLFATVLTFVIQMVAQKFTTSVKAAAIFSLEPVFGAIFAWTVGGENFTINGAIGGFIIVSAMLLAELPDVIELIEEKTKKTNAVVPDISIV